MYLGQERWGQSPAVVPAPVQGVKPGAAGVQFAQQPTKPVVQAAGSEVGDSSTFTINGCVDAVVGPTIRGSYQLAGLNHGRPAYKRIGQANGFDVNVFYWDERDGPSNCGWWFAPAIGSEQVWAYHPSRTSTPPVVGWKVPINGPVDQTIRLIVGGGKGKEGKGKQGGKTSQQGGKAVPPPAATQQQQLAHQQRQQQRMEQQKKAEEDKKKQQQAWAAIQVVVKKLNAALPETLEAVKTELDAILQKELDNCGAQKEKTKTDAEAAVKKAEERIKLLNERKEKEALERKEALEVADKLFAELGQLADAAEESLKRLDEAASPLTSVDGAKDFKDEDEISAAGAEVKETSADVQAKLKACSEFLLANKVKLGPLAMKPAPAANKEANGDAAQPTLLGTQQKIAQLSRAVDKHLSNTKVALVKAKTKLGATSKLQQMQAIFKKYDKDKDSMLNRKEVLAYAKGEFAFPISAAELDFMFEVIVGKGGKAVPLEQCQRLKVMIGVAREKIRNAERKSLRQAREKELAAARAKYQEVAVEASKAMDAADAALKEAESDKALIVTKASAAELAEHADKLDQIIASAKKHVEPLSEKSAELKGAGEEHKDLKPWLDLESTKFSKWAPRFEARVAKLSETAQKLRTDAKDKIAMEMEKLRNEVLGILRSHIKAKALTVDAFLDELADKSGKITSAAFLKAISTSEKPPGKEVPWKSEEDLQGLFAYLDDERSGFLTKQDLEGALMMYMRIVKEVGITDKFTIKDCKTIRKLELKECVKILEVAKQEEAAGVDRVKVKTLKDDIEGYVSLKGNQGTVYLEDGGGLFKVLKETILTPAFDIGAAPKSVKDTTHKLKVGDTVEVREWPKKDESSGLTRLKCRQCAPGGHVGWATAIGNTGTVFLQAL